MAGLAKEFGMMIGAYARSLPGLFDKAYRPYLFLPILINLFLMVATLYLSWHYNTWLLERFFGWFGGSFSHWPEFWQMVLKVIFKIVQILIFLSVYKYLVLICSAPFMAFVSEKVESDLSGSVFRFSWHHFAQDFLRALLINAWNFLREMLATLLLLLVALIPWLSLLAGLLLVAVQAYFYGYALFDYNAERWRWSLRRTESWMWQHKGAVLAGGLIFQWLFLIPLVGWIFAPLWAVQATSRVAVALERKD